MSFIVHPDLLLRYTPHCRNFLGKMAVIFFSEKGKGAGGNGVWGVGCGVWGVGGEGGQGES